VNKKQHSRLAEFLAQHGVRYKWVGTWPAIPVKLGPLEFDERALRDAPPSVVYLADGTSLTMPPPDVLPAWVERIYERLFEKILPPKKDMTIDFYDAAIFGYAYAAISRELAWRKEACKTLPPESRDRLVHEELAKHYPQGLDVCRGRVAEVLAGWKLPEAADYLKGFAYGIECQHREEGWTPSATTETLQIYKALLQHQYHVKWLIQQKATAEEIGKYIAERTIRQRGMTYAQFFETHPPTRDSVKLPSGELVSASTKEGRQRAARLSAKGKFLRFFEKIFERVGIPLQPPGRPRRNSDTGKIRVRH
jgi:hypothetical protein